jgi:hypothetical protein
MNKKIVYAFLGIILFFMLAPFVFFGDNAVVSVFDNLDSLIPWYKMFHDNGLFFKFDVPTKGYSELSTLYYGQLGFTFQALLYSVFDTFPAYALNYAFAVLFGILSMHLLLHKLFKIDPAISLAVSACYAILPVYQGWNIAAGTLPFIIFVFFHFALKPKGVFSRKTLLLVLYPAFSFFVSTGIFILGLWFVGTVIVCVKNKKPNPNLIASFILLTIGYILVDLRLFYVVFILKTPLNRSIMDSAFLPEKIIEMVDRFLNSLKGYFLKGHYHVASMQRRIILPGAALLSAVLLPRFISSIRNRKQNGALTAVDNNIMLLFITEAVIFIFAGIGALHDSDLLDSPVKSVVPVLAGFNWGRFWILNRALWMAAFALCLSLLLSMESMSIGFNRDSKKIVIPRVFFIIAAYALVFLQGAYIMLSPVVYNDQVKTWFNEIVIKTGIAHRNFDGIISYKEFFSEELFRSIKEDIAYDDEMVAAFGYHPSVLMYNGFNCIDGFNNSYPLSYMKKFRTLLEPEFETNIKDRDHYDSWGGRMYLYNTNLSTEPTRNKNTSPVELRIDMNVFKNDFNGKYILSRAEIANAGELGLFFVKRYDNEDSIYTIYLYKTGIE